MQPYADSLSQKGGCECFIKVLCRGGPESFSSEGLSWSRWLHGQDAAKTVEVCLRKPPGKVLKGALKRRRKTLKKQSKELERPSKTPKRKRRKRRPKVAVNQIGPLNSQFAEKFLKHLTKPASNR